MINFHELCNSIFINDFVFTFGIFIISSSIIFIIFVFIFEVFFTNFNFEFKENLITTIIFITISIISTFFIIRVMEKNSKEKFYKVAKTNNLNINYDNFILENKKLKNFCKTINEERKYLLYSKYDNDFCKIENGDVNSDTINEVFNELYSTINTNEKNKAVEEAIQFIKEDKIQIKVNNKTKGEKHD